MRSKALVALVALCLLAVQYAPAQSPAAPTPSPQQIAAKIDEYMNAAVKVNHFSGSILVARDGQPIISKGYGMANYELDVPNTPQTVFRMGSITKSFTAMAIMMLQERGKLSVSDSICKHLSDCPAAWQPITIRHLLTHTSGIPDYSNSPEAVKLVMLPVTPVELIGRLRDKPPEFAPGEKFNYSNSGYHLLGIIIERASGKPYEEFLQENIFMPVGMKNTGYDSNSRIIKNRAAGYVRQGGGVVNAPYIDITNSFASGALVSTTEDLLLWDKALYIEKLVTRKSLDEMFTPFKDIFPGKGYAYGWLLEKQSDRQAISHSGRVNGFAGYIMRFPSERVTVIVLSNNFVAPSDRIAKDLSAIVFGTSYKIPQERKAIAVASAILDSYVGQYQVAPNPLFPPNAVITITNENGKLMRQVNEGAKAELFAESETEFFLKGADVQVTFVLDAQGRVTGLIWHRLGRDIPASKIK